MLVKILQFNHPKVMKTIRLPKTDPDFRLLVPTSCGAELLAPDDIIYCEGAGK